MVVFETEGLLDLKTALVFGVSAKPNDDSIGLFGTGLKYALAILMREGAKVVVHTGLDTHVVGIESLETRGKEFDVVTLDGAGLGFTTRLGHHWEVWQAFRELHCNTLDEGGRTYRAHRVTPAEGKTFVTVELTAFDDVLTNLSKYFITKEPDLLLNGVAVHKRTSMELFYKKVKVVDTIMSKFTYDIKTRIDLTEDRTPKYTWQVSSAIARAISTCTDKVFLRDWLTQSQQSYENDVSFADTDVDDWSTEFKELCAEFCDSIGRANPSAMKQYRKWLGVQGERFVDVRLTPVQQSQLDKAKLICAKLEGTDKIHDMKIRTVTDIGKNILGMYRDGTIFITARVFDQGTKAVASTLYEEYVHCTHGYRNNTYEIQTFLFDKIMSMYEENIGEAI